MQKRFFLLSPSLLVLLLGYQNCGFPDGGFKTDGSSTELSSFGEGADPAPGPIAQPEPEPNANPNPQPQPAPQPAPMPQPPTPQPNPMPLPQPLPPPAVEPSRPTVNAASCSFADVQSAVTKAKSGDTVLIPAGDCGWGTQQLNVPGGIYLKGAGKTATVLRRNAGVAETKYLIAFNCSNGLPATLSDMTLAGFNNSAYYDKGLALLNTCKDFRVFNSKFTGWVFSAVYVQGAPSQRGVIYKNDFIDNYSAPVRNLGYGVVVYGDGTWPALELGTQNSVFVEDNFMDGQRHHIASNNGSRYVFRYNKAVANDLTKDYPMTDAHGLSSSPRGSRSYEVYHNTYSAQLTSGRVLASVGIRGGDGVIFNNTSTSDIAYPIILKAEGFTCGQYPGPDQIRSVYIWNNLPNSVRLDCSASIQEGRDYFLSARPGYKPYTYPHPLRAN